MSQWSQDQLKNYAVIKHGFAFKSEFFSERGKYVLLTPGNFREEGGFRWLGKKQKFYSGEVPSGYILKKNDFLVAMTEQAPGLLGSAILIAEDDKYLHNQRLGLIKINSPLVTKKFLFHVFNSLLVRKPISESSAGTKVKHTSPEKIGNLFIPVPPVIQQTAIADLLSIWDEAIEKTERLIAAKEKLYSGLIQTIIDKQRNDWQHLRADKIFTTVSEKNNGHEELLSVTQDRGVIPRTMLEGRVMSPDGSTDGYKLIKKGDFAISLRSFQRGIEFSEYQGIISPAYTVLRSKLEIDTDFYRHFFKSYLFIEKYLSLAVIGIRDGKQISIPDFMTTKIPYPSLANQQQIAVILTTALSEIDLLKQQADAMRRQKRGLMQKLLTGVWQVKTAEVEQ